MAGALDSDGDPSGSTNDAEIAADAQPGWTEGNANTIYLDDGTTSTNQPPGEHPGSASTTSPNSFDVSASMVLNNKSGLFFYSSTGRASIPFLGGTLCFAPPLRRTPIQFSLGDPPPDDCSGTYTFDFNAWWQGGNEPYIVAGDLVQCQYWSRDPNHPDDTGVGLTGAVEFELCP